MRGLLAALAVLLVAAPAVAQQIPRGLQSRIYDERIEESVRRWWPGFPYPSWWKAQLWQESRLRPEAVSPAGARGLAQIMPGTFRDLVRKADRDVRSPHDIAAIDLGAMYMADLTRMWRPAGRTARERHLLALASYNAGPGSIIKAQARCNGAVLWRSIAPCLQQVTGPANSRETRHYVEVIPEYQAGIERFWGRP